jgi:methanogenic corrinoid protein MtbC1
MQIVQFACQLTEFSGGKSMQAVKLTPKKVALAIGVSESSMKRWCDRGLIDFRTTAGGHRRLSLPSVIDFVRNSKHSLLKSEMIGLPAGIRPDERDPTFARQEFLNAIVSGNEEEARQILLELFLSGQSVAAVGDNVISPAFEEIGVEWDCGNMEVYRERRACEITLRILSSLRDLLPEAPATAPLAIGGAPEKDSYSLPTLLVEMVFREAGWRSQSLGSQLPFATMVAAAHDHRPRLFWLSVSSINDDEEFLQSFARFRQELPMDTFLAVGGRALQENIRQRMHYSAYGDNLTQLESLAKSLKAPVMTMRGPATVSNY